MKQKIQILLLVFTSLFSIVFTSYSHEINIKEIETIIKNYLIKNPKIIKSTLDDYKKTAEINKKNNAIKLLKDIKNPGIYNENSNICLLYTSPSPRD